MLLVRATLTLADSTEMPGFLTPAFPFVASAQHATRLVNGRIDGFCSRAGFPGA